MSNKFTSTIRNMSKGKKLMTMGATAIVAAALIGGATSAVLTSSDTQPVYAATGHVEIHVSKISVTNLLPGVPRSAPLTLDNTKSSAPVEFSLAKFVISSTKNPGNADLSQITVSIVDSSGHVLKSAPLSALPGAAPIDLGIQIPAGEAWSGSVQLSLPQSAGNEFQDLAVYALATYTGTQIVQ